MANIIEHPIKENALYINNSPYFGINVEKILVGVENENVTEIVQDTLTGLNYAQNTVEAQEVYNPHKHKLKNCFILDLETGSRGWFPGAKIQGEILNSTNIMSEPNTESSILETVSKAVIIVLNTRSITSPPSDEGWYKIKYDIIGYVPVNSVTNLKYISD